MTASRTFWVLLAKTLRSSLLRAPSEDQPTPATDSDTSTYGKQELTQEEVMEAAVEGCPTYGETPKMKLCW